LISPWSKHFFSLSGFTNRTPGKKSYNWKPRQVLMIRNVTSHRNEVHIFEIIFQFFKGPRRIYVGNDRFSLVLAQKYFSADFFCRAVLHPILLV
jgi:hypothetical protein